MSEEQPGAIIAHPPKEELPLQQAPEPATQEVVRPPVQVEVTTTQLESKRTEFISAIERAQRLPDSFVAADGRTKAQLLEALHGAMGNLRDELDRVRDQEHIAAQAPTNGQLHLEAQPILQNEQTEDYPHYITIGGATIPICQPPKDKAQWEAIVNKMFIDGGQKWAEVTYEKRGHGGLPQTLKPGDEIMFGEHRGERLPVIDNILEGAGEVRAFQEVVQQLASLQVSYEGLNPDSPDYDQQAADLAAKIDKFTTGEIGDLMDLVKLRVTDPEGFSARVREIITTRQFLREIDPESNEFIPKVDPNFKLTPYFEERMAWFAQLVNRQLGLGNNQMLEQLAADNQAPEWAKLQAKGMTVVVGPRGSGKNKLADHYAAISQRPMFRYACSPDKTEYDLTYDVVLKDGEVVKIPSRIITAITTPNALLELDEVNLLNPAVSKFFNSLLDHDRAIFLNNEVIESAAGVAIVGLMNPADYEGVQNLPETIDDRSNAMFMGYPPLRDKDPATGNERFTHDEAVILKAHIAPLSHINDQEFIGIWDHIVNGGPRPAALDPEVVRIVRDLKDIISIANKTRETVRAYKTRTGNVRMERDISLRGSVEAARFYSENHLWRSDLRNMPNYRQGWNSAAYSIASTYLPHTLTYKKGDSDKQALETILAEQIRL